MIESFFLFLHENPEMRWVLFSCMLCLTALLIWWPRSWVRHPFKRKPCAHCATKPTQAPEKELLPTPKPIAAPNPNIYRKSITFNKKNIEFDIIFPNDEGWKKEPLEPSFLEDPLHPNSDDFDDDNPYQNYTLQIRCVSPLSAPERQALYHYLTHEGYIEDAHKFYKK